MRILLLIIFLTSFSIFANEIPDTQVLQNKFVATLKDKSLTDIVGNSSEVQECAQKAKYDPKNSSANQQNLNSAISCFENKMKGKTEKELLEIADKLDLQSYGLVQSKNTAQVQSYLSDKMYEAMTGINRRASKEQQEIQMKFRNRKQVDQKVFIDLYISQLTKNSLFEVSRFCFENFRIVGKETDSDQEQDFATYWHDYLNGTRNYHVTTLTDTGVKGLGSFKTLQTGNDADKEKIYDDIFKNIGLNQNTNLSSMGNFFKGCLVTIKPLCDEFIKDKKKGSNACLTLTRLTKIKKAITDAETVSKDEFGKMVDSGNGISLDSNGQINWAKISADDLTSQDSSAILDNKISSESEKAAADCIKNKTGSNCDQFVQVGDELNQTMYNQELQLNFRNAAEKESIQSMMKDNNPKSIEDYLTKKGYLDILAEYQKDKTIDVATKVSARLDAEKDAALKAISAKVGKRQITEDDAKNGGKEDAIEKNAKNTVEERARLAQVVLFNNIITSQLELKDKNDSSKELGRNISGIKKEIAALKNNNNVDQNLFSGLQKTVDDPKNNNANASDSTLSGTGLIDIILDPTRKSD